MLKKTSPRKEKMIAEFIAESLKIGDAITIQGKNCKGRDASKLYTYTIKSIDGDTFTGTRSDGGSMPDTLFIKDIVGKRTYFIGADPFTKSRTNVESTKMPLSSILFELNLGDGDKSQYKTDKGTPIQPCNWNPYIFTKEGEKFFYQRDFVWTVEDKQLLVESIYQNIDCGKILTRHNSWQKFDELEKLGEFDFAWRDIVDGKQRLNAVVTFMNDEYPDLHGNYFSDLSDKAQNGFVNHQLFSHSALSESVTDEQVIEQFLKLNFAGVPQSKEHIDYVKSINQKLK